VSDDDRPKKSWRDIDKQRDRSGGGSPRRDKEESAREKASRSAAYSKYKSQLDGLFKPGGTELPESMKEKLGPVSEESKKSREVAEALRKDPSKATLTAYLESGQPLPDDPRLLVSLLDVRDESLVRPVLSALLALVEGGKKPNRMLLVQRLQAAANWIEEDETRALLDTLRAALD
jgi:hypothetical protein